MRIGVTVGLGARSERSLVGLIERAQQIEALGFDSLWMPTAFGYDAITALAVIGRETGRLQIGTAVIPTWPRHPVALAQQALTAQEALAGRFVLGVGLSHQVMMEDALGIPYVRPGRHMREYLSVLAPLLRGESAAFQGATYRVEASVTIATPARVPLLVAALGPAMLALAGTVADGTITSWVGPRTFEHHIVPTITRAATAAGRPAPVIAAGLPIILTDDADGMRRRLAGQVAWYHTLPAYQAMFEREGVAGPEDLALIGDEAVLDAHLARLAAVGVTDFVAQIIPPDPSLAAPTLAYLASRL